MAEQLIPTEEQGVDLPLEEIEPMETEKVSDEEKVCSCFQFLINYI